jgi:hypothetical protein
MCEGAQELDGHTAAPDIVTIRQRKQLEAEAIRF